MKHKNIDYYRKFRSAKFYLGDIEEIISILAKVYDTVEISTDRYELDNISELEQLDFDSINTLQFIGKDGHYSDLKLSIFEYTLAISARHNAKISQGDREILINIINRCSTPYYYRIFKTDNSKTIALNLFLLVFLLAINFHRLITAGIGSFTWLNYVSVTVVFGAVIFSLLIGKVRNQILLKYRKDSPSFWKRNQDEITVGLIMTVVGAIIGAVITLAITGTFTP